VPQAQQRVSRRSRAATETRLFSRRIPLIVAAAFFMETLDSTIVTTSLPAMARSFSQPTLALTSIVTVYMVAMVAFVATAGWASARFGARNLFAAAIGVFTLASLACGASPSYEVLLVARLVQGAAAAFMSPVGRLVVLRQTPKAHIINAIGLIVWPGLIAPVIGPPLGGLITTYSSWRWIFLVNIPVGIVGVLLVLRFVPADIKEAPVTLDKLGFALTAIALAALIQGLSLAGHPDARAIDYGSYILVGIGVGIVAVRHALKHPTPMLDLTAIRVPTFALCTISAGFLGRTAISMTPFLLPLMFQIGFGETALRAGVMLLVYMAGNLIMKSATTPILRRFGFRDVLRLNGAFCVASLIACAMLSPSTPMLATYVILFVAGMTRSMHFTSTSTLAFADVPDKDRPGASTLAAMAQQFASVFGVAVAAFALGASQSLGGGGPLALRDFQHALLAAAAVMAVAVAWISRLPRDAGIELSRKP
jgi:EmrB/QacA subfamily drug resistance transporter